MHNILFWATTVVLGLVLHKWIFQAIYVNKSTRSREQPGGAMQWKRQAAANESLQTKKKRMKNNTKYSKSQKTLNIRLCLSNNLYQCLRELWFMFVWSSLLLLSISRMFCIQMYRNPMVIRQLSGFAAPNAPRVSEPQTFTSLDMIIGLSDETVFENGENDDPPDFVVPYV